MASHSPQKQVIIVAGPTAAGKTALAITLAQAFGTEIISADSRQCYRELKIGVARPSEQELDTVPHHFIASHSIKEEITAAGFEQYALAKTRQLFERVDTIIMTGGTGLYLKAFTDGLDPVPPVDPALRQTLTDGYTKGGLAWLQDQARLHDPQFARDGEMQNPQRIMRALEVMLATGRSISSWQTGSRTQREFRIVKTAINLPREILNQRINERVLQMMQAGQLAEAQALLPFRHLNALRTVGYSELFDYLDGRTSLEQAVGLIAQHTRQYAKRQVTWFRKDEGYTWFTPSQSTEILRLAGK